MNDGLHVVSAGTCISGVYRLSMNACTAIGYGSFLVVRNVMNTCLLCVQARHCEPDAQTRLTYSDLLFIYFCSSSHGFEHCSYRV